jgi:DNA mismatch repair ATPase MutS
MQWHRLAGIPCRAMDSYLSRLIRAGLHVAVCEQVEFPAAAFPPDAFPVAAAGMVISKNTFGRSCKTG